MSPDDEDCPAGPPQWQELVEADPSAVFVLDPNARVAAWNVAAERLFDLAPTAVLGRPFTDLDISYRIPKLRATIEDVRRGLASARLSDMTIVPPDGQPLTVGVTVFRARSAADGPPGVIVRVEDRGEDSDVRTRLTLTEKELDATRVELQTAAEELQTSNEELRESNAELSRRLYELETAQQVDRHKNEFLAMLAHELRNPLAPMLSAMQVIRQQAGDDPITQRAREIVERQVRHQARLLDDLLDVSRITRGKIELRRQPLSLGSVVADALEITRSLIEARRQEITAFIADEPVVVEGDPTRLTQVVANLLNNAAKFTPPGGTIGVTVAHADGEAVLSVRDSGAGIPAEMLPCVFELFRQVDPSLARSAGGLGIGLTVARSLVELHGGTIKAQSEGRGHGAEFIVRLPLASAEVAATLGPGGTASVTRPRPRHILIVEDNADTRDMLQAALELDGHRVAAVEDGREGVEVALAARPEVVLIDIGLPGLDGYEVATRLRVALGPGVHLIALTGYGQPDDRRRALEAGFDAHLVKPVSPDDLARILGA